VHEDVPERLTALLKKFENADDLEMRTMSLLEYADKYRVVPPDVAVRPFQPGHRVHFCESEAYVWAVPRGNGTLDLHFAVENPSGVSAKALAAILSETLSGLTPDQILAVPDDLVQRVFRQNISMGKGMGLLSIVEMVKKLARQHVKSAGPVP